MLCLSDITPGPRALEIAASSGKVHEKIRQSWTKVQRSFVLRAGSEGLVIARHRLGWVCANAGIDKSSVRRDQTLLLLPVDPDESARRLALAVEAQVGIRPGVVVTDTFGRPSRECCNWGSWLASDHRSRGDKGCIRSGAKNFTASRGRRDCCGKRAADAQGCGAAGCRRSWVCVDPQTRG